AQPHVGLLAAAALAEIAANDVVEREWLRQQRCIDLQARRELAGQPLVEGHQAAVGLHAQQVRPNDGNDPTLLDVVEEVVPGVLVEALRGWMRRVHAPTPAARALPTPIDAFTRWLPCATCRGPWLLLWGPSIAPLPARGGALRRRPPGGHARRWLPWPAVGQLRGHGLPHG